jgi:hypothetical protein
VLITLAVAGLTFAGVEFTLTSTRAPDDVRPISRAAAGPAASPAASGPTARTGTTPAGSAASSSAARARPTTTPAYPALLSTRSTRLWLDAADTTTLIPAKGEARRVGRTVSIWRDRSPYHQHAAKDPLFPAPTISRLGGRTAVRFAGDGTQLDVPAAALPTGSAPSTVYVVATSQDTQPSAPCPRHLLGWGASRKGEARVLYNDCTTSQAHAEIFDTGVSPAGSGFVPNRPTLMTSRFTATGITVTVNGRPGLTWAPASAADTMRTADQGATRIGAAPWCTFPGCSWKGQIAEIIVLAGDPGAADDREITDYLTAKWGVLPG